MTVNHPALVLAEQYYAVAADLECNANEQLRTANKLKIVADRLCEQNMAETNTVTVPPKCDCEVPEITQRGYAVYCAKCNRDIATDQPDAG